MIGVLSLPSLKDAEAGLVSGAVGSCTPCLYRGMSIREMIATDTATATLIFFFIIRFSIRHKKLTTVIENLLKTVVVMF